MEAIESPAQARSGVRRTPSESVLAGAWEPTVRGAAAIPSLDGLRAVSIMLVLAGHAIAFPASHSFLFRALFLHADLGVRIFFVISGFLITSLLIQERSEFGCISLRLFYIRRALRILPAASLFVGIVALLNVLGFVSVPGRDWVYVLTYTVNFTRPAWVVGHLWSLSVEEQFYLLWPLAMKIARPRTCMAIAILALLAGIAVRAVYTATGIKLVDTQLRYAFPFVCGPIAMGCLLAMWAGRVRDMIVSSKFLSSGRILVFALPLIALLDTPDLGTANRFLGLLTNSLLTLCVAQLVFFPTSVLGRLLNTAPLVLIGKLSYSLYLWQQLFLNPFSSAPISRILVGLAATLAAASASYWGLEVRFLGLRKRFRHTIGPLTTLAAIGAGR
jgi:peptidoglycan/LPS O-acetylase OafA/YrhL